ncbi:MAG: SurA N-terminal domain-containing protein [Candidatus Omnitrophica bacterium]|nr:SurA N-terminal domain-containing protein [Candidatus Omnitrophota bacterium]
MLNKLRTRHSKRILWVLLIIIVPPFVFWGGASYLKSKKAETCIQIGNRTITFSEFSYYLTMANCLMNAGLDYIPVLSADKKLSRQDLERKALEYVLLLWKADQEKVAVSDREVVEFIKNKLFAKSKFDFEAYKRAIRLNLKVEPTVFEEYVENLLKIQKVLDKYVKFETTGQEIKDFYTKDTQKAKIAYLLMPYDSFKEGLAISEQETQDFYRSNELLFKEPPKVKIRYVSLSKDNLSTPAMLVSLNKCKTLDEVKAKLNLEIKVTDFIGISDPIEGIGWQEGINKIAFSLKKGKMSPPIETAKEYVVIEKQEERQSSIPKFDVIKDKAIEKLKEQKAKVAAQSACENALAKISQEGIKDLKVIASGNAEFKETDYFKYYDYIEGLGLDEGVSKIIFSLAKDEIYLKPIVLARGAYIIQLKDLTAFDEKDFEEKKETYKEYLTLRKNLIEKLKLLSFIEKEAKVRIYSILQQ